MSGQKGGVIRACALFVLLILLFGILGVQITTDGFHPDMSVHFLDVDQGDSVFIELPNRETMLIDSGEKYYGESILRYIRRLGHNKIDYFICTHPHSDHIGSARFIISNISVGELYIPKAGTTTELYENLLNTAIEKNLAVKAAEEGVEIIRNDELSVKIIAPAAVDEENLNNSSAVVRIYYRDSGFIFMGDAGTAELDAIEDRVRADVLKVSHHGSSGAADREFIDRVKPKISVISCGRENDYGHPHKNTLRLLEEAGSRIYRTDLDKTIIVRTDGYYLETETGAVSMKREK